MNELISFKRIMLTIYKHYGDAYETAFDEDCYYIIAAERNKRPITVVLFGIRHIIAPGTYFKMNKQSLRESDANFQEITDKTVAPHPWLDSIKEYAKMLDGEVIIPHLDELGLYCDICEKALQQHRDYISEKEG